MARAASAPRKILVVKPSALGDVVQALPVATGLARHWPGTEVHWVIHEAYADLLREHPSIRRLVLYPRSRWKSPAAIPEILRWAAALRAERYDWVLDLQGLLRSGLMTAATRSARRIGLRSAREGARLFYTEVVDDAPVSASERYGEALRHLGAEPDMLAFGLTPPDLLPEGLAPGAYVVFHPYTRWRTKIWPWRYYQDLADALAPRPVVLVGNGPWFPCLGSHVQDLRGSLELRHLMAVLGHAAALVSTDSGPAHLAAALGTPTLVLFGATDWRRTRPAGRKVAVLTHDVFCSPCLKRTCWRDAPMECLTGLAPARVLAALASWELT